MSPPRWAGKFTMSSMTKQSLFQCGYTSDNNSMALEATIKTYVLLWRLKNDLQV